MRKVLTLLAVLTGMALFVQGQVKDGKITGSIKDGPLKNLQSATVTLLNTKDSSSVKFSVTNKEGYYEFTNRFDARSVNVSFTYRFGKFSQQNQPRQHSNATQDEQSRVGGAN